MRMINNDRKQQLMRTRNQTASRILIHTFKRKTCSPLQKKIVKHKPLTLDFLFSNHGGRATDLNSFNERIYGLTTTKMPRIKPKKAGMPKAK
jgi:hypothetical protein